MVSRYTDLRPCGFALGILGTAALDPDARSAHPDPGAPCCICGGRAGEHGTPWIRRKAINDSFGPVDTFEAPESSSVCGACAFFAVGKTFHAEVTGRGPVAPQTGGLRDRRFASVKLWPQASWRSYSHLFSARDSHVIPRKADWRAFLTVPPEPPFLAIMTTAGTKNILYRGTVALDRDLFPVLVDEDTTWVDRHAFAEVLADFERAYAAGFSKDSLLSGDYNQAAVLAMGIAAWRDLEAPLAAHRAQRLPLMRLAHFVAIRPDTTLNLKEAA